ncbi:hypothetical protein [Streptomyces sp. TRM49041]|uniref:hypothetical protein n=1 Tax=Streptomyces sp. TRM49041 TaxID=2603216 RepID=UPI0011EEEC9D|nr:hypothetical protein [Streptomyces sp. TRM49041]
MRTVRSVRRVRDVAGGWLVTAVMITVALPLAGASWGQAVVVALPVATGMAVVWAVVDALRERRRPADPDGAAEAVPAPWARDLPPAGPPPPLDVTGSLGGTGFRVRRADGRTVLDIGGREFAVGPDIRLRYRQRVLRRSVLTVERPGEPPFVHRYRLPRAARTGLLFDLTYDVFTAEEDDDGLWLVHTLGGTSNWCDTED